MLRVSSRRRASHFSVFLLASSFLSKPSFLQPNPHRPRQPRIETRLARLTLGKSASYVTDSTFFVFPWNARSKEKSRTPIEAPALHSLRNPDVHLLSADSASPSQGCTPRRGREGENGPVRGGKRRRTRVPTENCFDVV